MAGIHAGMVVVGVGSRKSGDSGVRIMAAKCVGKHTGFGESLEGVSSFLEKYDKTLQWV